MKKFSLKLRKFFDIPDKEQKKLISEGCQMVRTLADENYLEFIGQDISACKKHNGVCTKCANPNIVERILHKDLVVNHCNDCGHEWDKKNFTNSNIDQFVCKILRELNELYSNPFYYEAEKTYELVKSVPAESISRLVSKHSCNCHNLTLDNLRYKFKSVYDR